MRLLTLVFAVSLASSAAAECPAPEQPGSVVESPVLRVATLNLAHGRGDGANQFFLKADEIRENLQYVGDVLRPLDVHLLALQEADGPSRWSGKFDHVELLAELTENVCTVHGVHASARFYDFGTALISRYFLSEPHIHHFAPSRPTTRKGFTLATISWNSNPESRDLRHVQVVSVHLDFSRKSVRRSQIQEMTEALASVARPLVVMGDFNSEWNDEESSVRTLSENLDLRAYRQEADDLGTYGKKAARLDWILASPDLRFIRYDVIEEVLSDHAGVIAEFTFHDDV